LYLRGSTSEGRGGEGKRWKQRGKERREKGERGEEEGEEQGDASK